MQWSDVDRRAKRTKPRQCVSDYGMHKDVRVTPRSEGRKWRFAPLRDVIRGLTGAN